MTLNLGRFRVAATACLLTLILTACGGDSIAAPEFESQLPDTGEVVHTQAAVAPVGVSRLQAASGSRIVAVSPLENGSRMYIDRTFSYDDVPEALLGHTYIRTRQGDREASSTPFMSFEVDRDAFVYIAYHGMTPPDWIAAAGFSPTGMTLTLAKDVQRQTHHLYVRQYSAGSVVLGANEGSGGESGPNMYTVIVRSAENTAPTAAHRGPYSGHAGVAMKFDGSGSSDPDLDLPLRFDWDFGDGSTSTGPFPSHTYASPGNYTVRLVVTDARGASGTATVNASVAVAPPFSSSQVSAGNAHACALRATGVVECWGTNGFGEAPALRTATTGRFTQLHTQKNHTCALRDDGVVECWGNNGGGRAPATRAATTGFFTQVEVGQVHSCALRSDGAVECWGGNGYGQAPPLREAGAGYFTQVAIGDDHSCALRVDGTVECWGQLSGMKAPVTGAFTQITSGDDHTCGLRNDGIVECWFLNQFGQTPPIRQAATGRFVSVQAGAWHTCGLRSDGVVECWGGNGWGQAPATQTASSGGYTQVDGGYYFTCALRNDGAFDCWGRNADGEARSEQRIVFTSTPPSTSYIGGNYRVTADGGGASATVVFSSLTPEVCSVSGWTVSPIAAGTCRVAANQAGGSRHFPSPQVTVSTSVVTPPMPNVPSGLTAAANSAGSRINLGWNDTSNNEDSFRIMRRTQTSPGNWGAWGWIASPPVNATSYTDTNVSSGSTYQYGVRACAGQNCSTWNFSSAATVP